MDAQSICDSGKRKGNWDEKEEARFSHETMKIMVDHSRTVGRFDETSGSEQKGVMQWTGIKLWTTEEKYDVDVNENGKKATALY